MKKTRSKKKLFVLLIIFILLSITGCSDKREIIMVAASLEDVVNNEYIKFGSNEIFINYGGSLSLARRIQSNNKKIGGVIFASKDSLDILIHNNLIDESSINILASNSLVIVTNSKNRYTLEDIFNINNTLLVSDPEIAPAGVYASQAIKNIFSEDFINKNIIYSGDVTYVSNILKNDKDLFGIIYNTEAIKNDLNVVYRIPLDYHDKIEYKVGVLKNNDNEKISEFLNIIRSESIKDKLRELGFLVK
ncbi:MAG: molybdate ABC transporter substrate-binding protein [Dehalococcoidia bacterium]|nr:molybdate ABC transporter substrate-binding protein [Dehalococcoidia bacterium]